VDIKRTFRVSKRKIEVTGNKLMAWLTTTILVLSLFVPSIALAHHDPFDGYVFSKKEKIDICHVKGNGDYQSLSPNVDGIITGPNGHDNHDDDIIPPFHYDLDDGDGEQIYDGKNWEESYIEIWENDCEVPEQEPSTFSISGYKFNDLDGNGAWDEGEDGLDSWTIYIDENENGEYDDGEPSVVTDSEGAYTFSGLEIDTYIIREVQQEGWLQTLPSDNDNNEHEVTLENADITDIDFGNMEEEFLNGSISGYKFNDLNGDGVWDEEEPGLAEWVIYVDENENGEYDDGEPTVTTDEEGYYEFTGLESGTYIVRETQQEGWLQTLPSDNDNNEYEVIIEDADVVDANFGNQEEIPEEDPTTFSVSGSKFNDLDGDGVWGGEESGLAEWAIHIDENDNGEFDDGEPSTVTDEDGYYVFIDLEEGTYIIREVQQAGWTQTAPDGGKHTIELVDEDMTDLDFGNQYTQTGGGGGGEETPTFSISGSKFNDLNGDGVWDEGESGLFEWTIYIDENDNNEYDDGEPTTVTDSEGSYTFTNLEEGTYIIREVQQEGWLQTLPSDNDDNEYEVAISDADVTDIDFGNMEEEGSGGSILGIVFNDLNENGTQDEDEPGLGGEAVYLDLDRSGDQSEGDIVVRTDEDGFFSIAGLPNGVYYVRMELGNDWKLIYPTQEDDEEYEVTIYDGITITLLASRPLSIQGVPSDGSSVSFAVAEVSHGGGGGGFYTPPTPTPTPTPAKTPPIFTDEAVLGEQDEAVLGEQDAGGTLPSAGPEDWLPRLMFIVILSFLATLVTNKKYKVFDLKMKVKK